MLSVAGTFMFTLQIIKELFSNCVRQFFADVPSLTHFSFCSIDYQGLTRSFCHGKIYCSSITASLAHHKIGFPWVRLHVLPMNEKITIVGINLTCFDANHCPGSIIILFEPPNGKVSMVLCCFLIYLA
jgi:Cft2 family RNA processing exonuclease